MVASTAPHPAPPSAWDKPPAAFRTLKKKSNPLMPLAVAAMVALVGSGVWRVTHSAPTSHAIMILTAKRDLPAGARLGFTTVQYLSVPKQFATPDMITSLNDASDRITRAYIPQGEPIKASMLFPVATGLLAISRMMSGQLLLNSMMMNLLITRFFQRTELTF